ncbi:carboxypeptidase-like regulatory domain-containing protein, partial [Patescibacteria group bacterium]|nr:carboxypeptidase-like regulatory domain-containing protein [Patescibacteria group bacterium]MBU1921698.1 carboxypeptidase-like regulatory domain-containing protein [Patescibacteria group bacterium]
MSKIRSAIYILVAIVASFTIAGSVHAARFELSPSSATFREGCNSAVNIMMSTQGAESDAANIIIHYNPAEIGIVDLNDSLPGVQIQPGSTYDIYADNIALPGDAIIRLTGFSIGHAYNSGAAFGNFGAIVFKSFAGIPSTTFTIDYVPGDTTDSNIAEYITSNDLLTGVANGSYTFEVGPCVDDVSAPWVSDPFPAPNSENVPLDSNVTFRIRDNQSGVDISSIVVEVQGVEYSRDGVNRFISAGDAMDYFITVDPIVDFPDGVIVRVEVRAQDFAGNVMAPYRWFFNQPPEPPEEPPTCEELGCPSPEECLPPEEIPECVEPEEIEIPDQTVSEEERLEPGLIEFWASRKTVRLFPDALGVVKVLFGTSYSIKFQQNILPKEADSAWWYIGQSTYQLALDTDEQTYWGDFGAYGAIAAVPAHMIINYSDGTTDVLDFTIQTVPFGSIYEITDQQETPVDNVKVTIYQLQSPAQLWNAAPYNQRNPVWTSEDGKYGFYVPRGYYYILLEKPGYEITQSPTFYARASIINNAILLERTPVVLEPLEAVAESIIQAGETVADTAERIQDAIQNTIMEALPGTEEQAEEAIGIAAPVAVGLALLNFGTAISLVNLLPLLYALFTQPLLLLGKRKRKRWGVVYNSISKVPIDLAVVRLIDLRTKKIVRTRITDREGRYFFMAKPGSYRIEVAKPGFVFPTVTLRQEKEDSQYIDLYHGEAIVVREASRQITVNIPIDPVVATERPLKLIIYFYLRKIQMAVASISILLALGLLMVNPSWLMLVYFVAQVAIFALFWRLAKPKKPKGWGIVYDRNTKKPLANAIVRIFDHKFNRLLEAQVTDSKGRYSFLVGSNKYFTTYEKPGYRTKKLSPIDYSGREEGTLVNYDVGLDKDKRPKKLRSERPDDHKSAGQI